LLVVKLMECMGPNKSGPLTDFFILQFASWSRNRRFCNVRKHFLEIADDILT